MPSFLYKAPFIQGFLHKAPLHEVPRHDTMNSIEFRRVSKRFPSGTQGLNDISLAIDEGSMVCIMGHSGAGKSTLLKLLLRFHEPSRGQISVNGMDIARIRRRHLPAYRRTLGTVFQDHHLLPERTAFENVSLPLRVVGVSGREIKRRVRAALDDVGLLDKAGFFPELLSTGEQQRLGIARAVVHRPRILLADEPTGNLDPALSRTIMNLFLGFRELGTTVIVASHDTALVEELGVRVIKLQNGALVSDQAGDGAPTTGGRSVVTRDATGDGGSA